MKKSLFMLILLSGNILASTESICDLDGRVPHSDLRIGRLKLSQYESACTVTMISPSCAISAGHCMGYMKTVEFDVPQSKFGQLSSATPQNTYEVDPASIEGMNFEIGNDWAVMKIKPNKITGKYPGDVGGFYSISTDDVRAGEEISIAGYGRDNRGTKSGNGTLQIDRGTIQEVSTNLWGSNLPFKVLVYKVDTEPGDSGSVIIRERDQAIVGIHTNGGACGSQTGNMGTHINSTKKMQAAIKKCLAP